MCEVCIGSGVGSYFEVGGHGKSLTFSPSTFYLKVWPFIIMVLGNLWRDRSPAPGSDAPDRCVHVCLCVCVCVFV